MLSVAEALETILQHVAPADSAVVPLAEALGLVLAEDVVSDVDSPPFDKALMDGYAVRSADLTGGTARLEVLEEVTAGRVPTRIVGAGQATRIMTGAPIPEGADAVVRIEDTNPDGDGHVHMTSGPLGAGTNLLRRGATLQRGETVLSAGRLLRPQEVGALAELGKHELAVRRRPRVAVLATGDELVPVAATPGPGQIRNSNESMLVAQIRRAGAEPVPLGIACDDREQLHERISAGLESDVLLLSGGVSAGKLDLVPSELERAGVRQVFHKVHVKPGKPLWFGVFEPDDSGAGGRRYVFGLPGNPVSSLVCFELFARSAIRQLLGHPRPEPPVRAARLAEDHLARGDRPTYHPARLESAGEVRIVHLLPWQGSADLRATVDADAMAVIPAGERDYRAGDVLDVIAWD